MPKKDSKVSNCNVYLQHEIMIKGICPRNLLFVPRFVTMIEHNVIFLNISDAMSHIEMILEFEWIFLKG